MVLSDLMCHIHASTHASLGVGVLYLHSSGIDYVSTSDSDQLYFAKFSSSLVK